MSAVFADAFYFIARINRRDQHHSRVVAFSRNFRARLITTDWVLTEVADALSASECRLQIQEFVSHLRRSAACDVIPASRDIFDRGLELYHRHKDKQWTLTDCTSFIAMRDRALLDALTEDHHFEQAGFKPLLK